MRRHIIGGLVVAVIALIGGAYMLPQMVHIERTTVIDRPTADHLPVHQLAAPRQRMVTMDGL